MEHAPRSKVRESLRSAHDWDQSAGLAPPPSPPIRPDKSVLLVA